MQLIATDPDGVQIALPSNWAGFNALVQADTADANDAPAQTLGSKFNAPPVLPPGATADFDGGTGRVFTGLGTAASLANGDLLASFTYVADVVGDTTFSFNVTNDAFNAAVFDTGTFTAAAGLNASGMSTITVTAVPEPSSFALLGLVGVGLCVARYRRRK